jgi:hypothetical protein
MPNNIKMSGIFLIILQLPRIPCILRFQNRTSPRDQAADDSFFFDARAPDRSIAVPCDNNPSLWLEEKTSHNPTARAEPLLVTRLWLSSSWTFLPMRLAVFRRNARLHQSYALI